MDLRVPDLKEVCSGENQGITQGDGEIMPYTKTIANDNLRNHIKTRIPTIPIGGTIKTSDMSTYLQSFNRCIGVTNNRVGKLMAGFDNFESQGHGVFVRVK